MVGICVAVSFALANGLAWCWLFFSNQDFSDRSARNAIWISLRLVIVFAVVLLNTYYWFDLEQHVLLILITVAVVSMLVCAIGMPGHCAIDNILLAMAAIPFFFAGQFVLGFPIQKQLVLEPEPDLEPDRLPEFASLNGMVKFPLRPIGTVDISGKLLNARSENGGFVETGTAVVVVDEVGATVVVKGIQVGVEADANLSRIRVSVHPVSPLDFSRGINRTHPNLRSQHMGFERVRLTGYIVVPPSDLENVRGELPRHIELTRAEQGCLIFEVREDRSDPCVFHVEEEFADTLSFQFHQTRVAKSHWGAITKNVRRHYEILGLPTK